MSTSQENHDDMLFQILKDCKTLPNFLDRIFGFLHRRTDFYQVAEDSNAAVGLPEGLAEKLLRHTFFKWKTPLDFVKDSSIPAVVEEIIENDGNVVNECTAIKEESEQRDVLFSMSDCYNGAKYENYCWSQTISDIDIIVKVPDDINKKDLKVDIFSGKISVMLKDTHLLKGELFKKCKAGDAIWSLDNSKLNIHLDKCQEIWWNCLVTSEPALDISKIDCSRPYEDLPSEAQAKIEELQWNQERKRLGLPTSDELAMHEMLKKAWHAKGSPFSGPFDPNAVNIN